MQAADDVVWSVLNGKFCSYKVLTKAQKFCRNDYNVNGICSRTTCPLANSQYATVREEQGICYLYSKIVERAQHPDKLWEKTKLSRNMPKAKQQIEEKLKYWPKPIRKKCHLRLLTIHDYLARIRKLMLTRQKELVPIRKKIERRETKKETKALAAAKLEKVIEKELLRRLKENTYGDLYNFSQVAFERALDAIEEEGETLKQPEEEEEEGEHDDGSEAESEFVEDFEESELEDEVDIEETVLEEEIEAARNDRKSKIPVIIGNMEKKQQRVKFKDGSGRHASSPDLEDDVDANDDAGVVTLWKRRQAPKPRLEIEYETEPAGRRKLIN